MTLAFGQILLKVDPSEGIVSLHHSTVVADKLLCGVALHGSGASVVAYDSVRNSGQNNGPVEETADAFGHEDQLYHVNF